MLNVIYFTKITKVISILLHTVYYIYIYIVLGLLSCKQARKMEQSRYFLIISTNFKMFLWSNFVVLNMKNSSLRKIPLNCSRLHSKRNLIFNEIVFIVYFCFGSMQFYLFRTVGSNNWIDLLMPINSYFFKLFNLIENV